MQFFDPAPINPIVQPQNNIFYYREADENVKTILRFSCFDCHSNQTNYPWYAYVAPVSWLVDHHVEEGRDKVNFSRWVEYTPEEHKKILDECYEEVDEGHMPLKLYKLMHPKAQLANFEKQLLLSYFSN